MIAKRQAVVLLLVGFFGVGLVPGRAADKPKDEVLPPEVAPSAARKLGFPNAEVFPPTLKDAFPSEDEYKRLQKLFTWTSETTANPQGGKVTRSVFTPRVHVIKFASPARWSKVVGVKVEWQAKDGWKPAPLAAWKVEETNGKWLNLHLLPAAFGPDARSVVRVTLATEFALYKVTAAQDTDPDHPCEMDLNKVYSMPVLPSEQKSYHSDLFRVRVVLPKDAPVPAHLWEVWDTPLEASQHVTVYVPGYAPWPAYIDEKRNLFFLDPLGKEYRKTKESCPPRDELAGQLRIVARVPEQFKHLRLPAATLPARIDFEGKELWTGKTNTNVALADLYAAAVKMGEKVDLQPRDAVQRFETKGRVFVTPPKGQAHLWSATEDGALLGEALHVQRDRLTSNTDTALEALPYELRLTLPRAVERADQIALKFTLGGKPVTALASTAKGESFVQWTPKVGDRTGSVWVLPCGLGEVGDGFTMSLDNCQDYSGTFKPGARTLDLVIVLAGLKLNLPTNFDWASLSPEKIVVRLTLRSGDRWGETKTLTAKRDGNSLVIPCELADAKAWKGALLVVSSPGFAPLVLRLTKTEFNVKLSSADAVAPRVVILNNFAQVNEPVEQVRDSILAAHEDALLVCDRKLVDDQVAHRIFALVDPAKGQWPNHKEARHTFLECKGALPRGVSDLERHALSSATFWSDVRELVLEPEVRPAPTVRLVIVTPYDPSLRAAQGLETLKKDFGATELKIICVVIGPSFVKPEALSKPLSKALPGLELEYVPVGATDLGDRVNKSIAAALARPKVLEGK